MFPLKLFPGRVSLKDLTGERPDGGRFAEGFGAVAQLGEHLLCKQGVSGSIPLSSTIFAKSFPRKPVSPESLFPGACFKGAFFRGAFPEGLACGPVG